MSSIFRGKLSESILNRSDQFGVQTTLYSIDTTVTARHFQTPIGAEARKPPRSGCGVAKRPTSMN